ncbi:MAG: 3-dehydroquinate synthase [Pyrinomonadaceae bacterium]
MEAKGKRVRSVRVRLKERAENYHIEIGVGLLATIGERARRVVTPEARRAFIITNSKVFKLYGEPLRKSLRRNAFAVETFTIGDGERYKSLRTLESALVALQRAGVERSDLIVALGGGVIGDLAGLAAALYLRGIALLQIPTTLLAQIDSSVGGKTAVNMTGGKNLIGAFHHPRAVIVDTATLDTLPARELTAGWCEAVKQGAIGSRKLFDETCRFLVDESQGTMNSEDRAERLAELIAAQCAFKATIVAGDERENLERTDARSRRILNFGHTVAHALESVTAYKRFRHGEAVGYGMLVAGELSVRLGLCDVVELERLRDGVRLAGRLPRADDLDHQQIISAISGDKKSVGGHIKWVLIEKLGGARLVDGREIPARVLRASLRAGLKQAL